jgi:hypothetical protein
VAGNAGFPPRIAGASLMLNDLHEVHHNAHGMNLQAGLLT